MSVKVTIVVTCYNLENTIKRCLDSLRVQTHEDLEIIVVDDGSKDNSFGEIQAAAEKDVRIIPVRQENSGPSAARNHGLDLATGKYLMFVDGDDFVDDTYVEHFIEAAEDCDLVISGLKYLYSDGSEQTISEKSYHCTMQEYVQKHYTDSIANRSVFGPVCKLYRREIISEHHIRFDETIAIHEDGIFVFEYMSHVQTIAGIPWVEYYYVQHAANGSLVSKFFPNELEINSRHFNMMLSLYAGRELTDAEQLRIYPMFLNTELATIRKLYYSKDYTFKKGIRYIQSVIKDKSFQKVRKALAQRSPKAARKYYRPVWLVHTINYLSVKLKR